MIETLIGTRPKSQAVFKASEQVIPGGVNSPVRSFYSLGIPPLVVAKGSGALIWDLDGNSYIDYCCSWGSLILGHTHPQVVEAVLEQLQNGSSFGITTEIEYKLALQIVELIPSIEKIRFVSSGTEATMSAARLARGFTGRSLIVKFNGHYHGHSDGFLIKPGSGATDLAADSFSAGVPKSMTKETISLPFNDTACVREFLQKHREEVAAVILEPIAGNMGLVPADRAFMEMLRKITEEIGALLIFDEVITGFRVALGGAQSLYGIKPDLTCFGKIIGGGFPAAAFGGRKEIMDCLSPLGSVYQAGTLSGNPIAMTAGFAALKAIQAAGFYEELELKCQELINPVQEEVKRRNLPIAIHQIGSLFTLFFGVEKVTSQEDLQRLDTKMFAAFFKFLFERGIYAPPSAYETFFISSAHTKEQLEKTRNAILEFIALFYR